MQLQGFMIMVFMLVIAPIMFMLSDHNTFFVVCAFVLIIVSLRNIYGIIFFQGNTAVDEEDEDILEELDEGVSADLHRFGTGTMVIRNLIIVLFCIYSTFFLSSGAFKAAAGVIAIYWTYVTLIEVADTGEKPGRNSKTGWYDTGFVRLAVNAATVIMIVLVVYNKYINFMF